MQRVIAVAVVLALVALLLTSSPAQANGRFWGAFVAGGLTGLIIGGALAAPPYGPPTVVYPYPPYAYPRATRHRRPRMRLATRAADRSTCRRSGCGTAISGCGNRDTGATSEHALGTSPAERAAVPRRPPPSSAGALRPRAPRPSGFPLERRVSTSAAASSPSHAGIPAAKAAASVREPPDPPTSTPSPECRRAAPGTRASPRRGSVRPDLTPHRGSGRGCGARPSPPHRSARGSRPVARASRPSRPSARSASRSA